jgi:molybdopterin-guanine dinucleotide biosynthesis protein A
MSGEVAGIILAGGLSRRMGGGDKALRLLGEKPLLQHVIDRLWPQVSAVAINANGDPARYLEFGLPVIADATPDRPGPLAGVLAGMDWAAAQLPEAKQIVTVACDTPFFPADLVDRFFEARKDRAPSIVLAESGGQLHPVFGLWDVALRDDLEAALADGTRKVLDWTSRHRTFTASFGPVQVGFAIVDPFFNANTPEELAQAETFLAEHPDE